MREKQAGAPACRFIGIPVRPFRRAGQMWRPEHRISGAGKDQPVAEDQDLATLVHGVLRLEHVDSAAVRPDHDPGAGLHADNKTAVFKLRIAASATQ